MMDPRIASVIRRYLSYGWKSSIIQRLLLSRFNAPVSVKCIKNIAENRDCSPRCLENCVMKDAELWFVPDFDE